MMVNNVTTPNKLQQKPPQLNKQGLGYFKSCLASYWPWLIISLIIFIVDQLSKTLVSQNLVYGQRLNVLPIFDITLLFNTGAAFSFLADFGVASRWIFTAIALLAIVLILYWLNKYKTNRLFCLALSLILAGALGNVYDRIMLGHVVDFLLFYWHEWYYPAFNVADIAISCGAILLIVDELVRIKKTRKNS